MSILKWFPQTQKMSTPRPQQIEVLEWYEKKRSEGARKFIICAPTGSGKSGIAKTIANCEASQGRRVLITSPLNTLVDQYQEFERDLKFPLKTLEGKTHYSCVAMREVKGERQNCENGFCAADICTLDFAAKIKQRGIKLYDSRKCDSCNRMYACPCVNCNYRAAFKEFKNSLIANTNFTLLQMNVTNSPDILIIDECDYMEPFIRMFRKVIIDEYWKFDQFEDYVLCLENKALEYKLAIEKLENSLETAKLKKIYLNKIERIERLLEDVKENNAPYIVSEENQKTTPFEPVTIDRFVEAALDVENRVVILMSATPQKLEGWEFIEVKSPFPAEIRPFKYVPVGSMALKGRQETIPKLAQMLITRENLLPGKSIVHVPSYTVAGALGQEILRLSKNSIKPIIQSRQNTVEDFTGAALRQDVIEKFKKDKDSNKILIAVNMGRGIDLPEADITNNIITFVKRQNPTDHLVRAKWKYLGKEWEYQDAANEIMQQYGRVNRNNEKVTNTIITEPEWEKFFRKNQKYFRQWFIEAVV